MFLTFYALPFEAIRVKELCFHRDVVRRWVQGIVDMVEPDTCRRMAEEWLPEGQYVQPKTYFIYDGNGDAFTQWGSVVFDLFSLIMAQRPPGGRFDNLGEAANGDIEPVLSHEYHHVFARQFLSATLGHGGSGDSGLLDRRSAGNIRCVGRWFHVIRGSRS